MPQNLCLCDRAPRLELRTRVSVVMHYSEIHRTSNTGRLVPLALVNSCLCLRGQKGKSIDAQELIPKGYQALILYPSQSAEELNASLLSKYTSPLALVALDGNWNQASRMYKREPALRCWPLVRLPAGPPSYYKLRAQSRPERVCTFEAVSRALGIIEGMEVQRRLEDFFRMMVDRMLWARGRMKAHEVYGGLPDGDQR